MTFTDLDADRGLYFQKKFGGSKDFFQLHYKGACFRQCTMSGIVFSFGHDSGERVLGWGQ